MKILHWQICIFLALTACGTVDYYSTRPTEYIGIRPYYFATDTIVPTPTETATYTPTITLTPSSTRSPTITPSLSPTITPSPSPTLTNIVVFSDDFEELDGGWNLATQEYNYAVGAPQLVDHVLRLQAEFFTDSVIWMDIPNVYERNFILEFEALFREPSNSRLVSIGVFFRRVENNDYYLARYFNTNEFAFNIANCNDDTTSPCKILSSTTTPSSEITLDRNQITIIRIDAFEGVFTFYANGSLIGTFEDQSILEEGSMGIGIYGTGGNKAVVDFDNITIYEND